MKAVILELRDGFAAALTERSDIIRVPDQGYQIGQELTLTGIEKKPPKRLARWVTGAAAALMLCCFGAGAYAFYSPCSYVTLDVNPSIQYTLNRFDRVLDVEAVNDDANDLVEQLKGNNVIHDSISDAIEDTLALLEESGYLDNSGGSYVVCSVYTVSEQDSEATLQRLTDDVSADTESYSDLTAQVVSADQSLREEAAQLGISAGKLWLLQQLGDAMDDDISYDQWSQKPIYEIVDAINQVEAEEESVTDSQANLLGDSSGASGTQDTEADTGTQDASRSAQSGTSSSQQHTTRSQTDQQGQSGENQTAQQEQSGQSQTAQQEQSGQNQTAQQGQSEEDQTAQQGKSGQNQTAQQEQSGQNQTAQQGQFGQSQNDQQGQSEQSQNGQQEQSAGQQEQRSAQTQTAQAERSTQTQSAQQGNSQATEHSAQGQTMDSGSAH
ncbi:MAG: hypothetical protein H6Q60_129 [Oscillospiraceae bacterium]|nr:hypothetical protein [Oscillospiraceae bacterium]